MLHVRSLCLRQRATAQYQWRTHHGALFPPAAEFLSLSGWFNLCTKWLTWPTREPFGVDFDNDCLHVTVCDLHTLCLIQGSSSDFPLLQIKPCFLLPFPIRLPSHTFHYYPSHIFPLILIFLPTSAYKYSCMSRKRHPHKLEEPRNEFRCIFS